MFLTYYQYRYHGSIEYPNGQDLLTWSYHCEQEDPNERYITVEDATTDQLGIYAIKMIIKKDGLVYYDFKIFTVEVCTDMT